MSSIKVSPKYGVNPTIPICFFCGKQKNELVLLGRLKGDIEAPKNMCLDYEPCDECKKNMALGVTLIGVLDSPFDERPPIYEYNGVKLYPTGSWAVMKDEAVERMFGEEHGKAAIETRKMFIDNKILTDIQERYQNLDKE